MLGSWMREGKCRFVRLTPDFLPEKGENRFPTVATAGVANILIRIFGHLPSFYVSLQHDVHPVVPTLHEALKNT